MNVYLLLSSCMYIKPYKIPKFFSTTACGFPIFSLNSTVFNVSSNLSEFEINTIKF